MTTTDQLRHLGLFDSRVPRYTSYPPANHFAETVGPAQAAHWIESVAPGSAISLYVHIPYCRTLCWFCACRTQGTKSDRPLQVYLDHLMAEIDMVDARLPADVTLGRIHLGGGTPTILPPDLLTRLCDRLRALRPWTPDAEFSVEIDPTEIDASRLAILRAAGMTRASIGVQDFDPEVQKAIGREQSYELTRDVVAMLRDTGIASLNMDMLYGLPHQNRARLADSTQKLLALEPDRIALYGYAHVPWMAKRQVMIPADALPGSEARLELFDTARRLLVWAGYRAIGIDHFALGSDALSRADAAGTLHRNFQGYTDDASEVLIGLGASAISRYPQGYAQNMATSSRYVRAIGDGGLATARGHAFSDEDRLRAAMIEEIMCRYSLDTGALARRFGLPQERIAEMTARLVTRFASEIEVTEGRIALTRNAGLIARLAAHELDAYVMPEGRHSRAL